MTLRRQRRQRLRQITTQVVVSHADSHQRFCPLSVAVGHLSFRQRTTDQRAVIVGDESVVVRDVGELTAAGVQNLIVGAGAVEVGARQRSRSRSLGSKSSRWRASGSDTNSGTPPTFEETNGRPLLRHSITTNGELSDSDGMTASRPPSDR